MNRHGRLIEISDPPGRCFAEFLPASRSNEILDSWIELSQVCATPNPNYEPNVLQAVCEHILPDKQCQLVLLWSDQSATQLAALFPVTKSWFKEGFAFPVSSLICGPEIPECTPLIHPKFLDVAWILFLTALQNTSRLPSNVYLSTINTTGLSGQALQRSISVGRLRQTTERDFLRPILTEKGGLWSYPSNVDKKKLRNIKKRLKKLDNIGEVKFHITRSDDGRFSEILENFLELEASGWKGRSGTAYNCNPSTREFAQKIYNSERRAPDVEIAYLTLDDRMVAGMINFISQSTCYTDKLAHDEQYDTFGPGILLDHKFTEFVADTKRYECLNSVSDVSGPIRYLWTERETIRDSLVQLSSGGNQTVLNFLLISREIARISYRRLKSISKNS